MKLLILTQKVDINDDVLGFMHGWIAEFAKKCEKVTVVCLQKEEYDLPPNVKVLSLGKETGEAKIKYLVNFYKYIWRERKNYDVVLVHMNQIYAILGGLLWRWTGKKIGFWYAHGHVGINLKIAAKMVNYIFTPTFESFRISSKKINVLGHGIDTIKFGIQGQKFKVINNKFKIITIGRISPVKDYETLIKAAKILANEDFKFKVQIIGGPAKKRDDSYLNKLKKLADEKNLSEAIDFAGAIPNKNIVDYLQSADLFVNLSHTGSLDKAVLEAMACGLPTLTCNEAFNSVFDENMKSFLFFTKNNAPDLANKIKKYYDFSEEEKEKLSQNLRNIVVKDHNLTELIKKIINNYQKNECEYF